MARPATPELRCCDYRPATLPATVAGTPQDGVLKTILICRTWCIAIMGQRPMLLTC